MHIRKQGVASQTYLVMDVNYRNLWITEDTNLLPFLLTSIRRGVQPVMAC